MTFTRNTSDLRQLAWGLWLGIPLLVLLLVIGSTMLLHTFAQRLPDTSEPPGSFVCMSDVAGTLLLCESNSSVQPTSEIVRWTAGNMTN